MELHTDASNPLEIKKCCKISLLAKLGVDTVENTRRKGPQNRRPFTGPEGEIPLHRKAPDRRETPCDAQRSLTKDWIELFIRNEKILSPDSEISRNFHNFFAIFLQF